MDASHAGQHSLAEDAIQQMLKLLAAAAGAARILHRTAGGMKGRSEEEGAAALAAPLAQFWRLQLRAARCSGHMGLVAEAHGELAATISLERPWHVEILANCLAYLRSSSRRDDRGGKASAKREKEVWRTLQAHSSFWFGEAPALGKLVEWADTCGLAPQRL
eukprot:TRINITY_DN71010_c0_g2_i1.p3 TRINITY_DN71010_c0_g2~~TRINITY_DN71010_c0_g2_i1.p3  ORF type:complete len:162 (-),score=31.59 TRINITY_DN71010_c0_g2_i1:222-707(-)